MVQFLVPPVCLAQQDYVVLNSGDTLWGKVQIDRSETFVGEELSFMSSTEDQHLFTPKEVLGFGYLGKNGVEKFKTRTMRMLNSDSTKKVFLNVIEEGEVNLVSVLKSVIFSGEEGGIENSKSNSPEHLFFLEQNLDIVLVQKRWFRNSMSAYFEDNDLLREMIDRRELKYDDLQTIVRIYNKGYAEAADLGQYEAGYVELESGAKLRGMLKKLSRSKSCTRVVYMDEAGKRVKIKSDIIKRYKRGENLYERHSVPSKVPYVDVETTNISRFLKVLVDGPVKLLKLTSLDYEGNKSSSGYSRTDRGRSMEVMRFYLVQNDSLFWVTRSNFKRSLSEYFSDHPKLAEDIDKGKLKFKDLKAIVRAYNDHQLSEEN